MKPIEFLPVGFFGAAMGLSGLCIAWRLAQFLFGAPFWVGESIAALAAAAFVLIGAGYLAKLALYPRRVVAEWKHPVIGPLFSTIFISLLLEPIVIMPYAPLAAQVMWFAGASAMSLFTIYIVRRWLSVKQEIDHPAPTWFVPVIGALNIPAAGLYRDSLAVHEFYTLTVAVGLIFAFVLFTLVFARLIFRPLPEPLVPTLAILAAPFGVGFVGYTQTMEGIDRFASLLYFAGVFIVVMIAPRLLRAAFRRPFRIVWWAISFPLASVTVSAVKYASSFATPLTLWLAAGMLALSSLATLWLLLETLWHLAAGDLFTPEIEAAAKAEAAIKVGAR